MTDYHALDNLLLDGWEREAPAPTGGAEFFGALVKMAMEGVPDTEGVTEDAAEASPQGQAMAVPLLQQLISSLFAQQIELTVGSTALGKEPYSMGMGGSWTSREDARILLEKLAFMTGGGFAIPAPPKITPPVSKEEMQQQCLARLQQHVVLAQKLVELFEGDPFEYRLKQMVTSMNEHMQKMTIKARVHEREEAMEAEGGEAKTAAAAASTQQESPQDMGEAQPKGPATQAATVPNAAAQPIFIPSPEQDSPAIYVAREQKLLLAQQGQQLAAAQQQANQLA